MAFDGNDDEGCIVDSGIVDCSFQECVGGGLWGTGAGGEGVGDVAFPESVDEAIGADEEAVSGLVWDGGEVGADVFVAATDDFVEGGSAGVGAVLDFGDFGAFPLSPGGGVVAGELLELAGAGEVDSGVADVGEVEVFRGEPGEGEGGGHAAGIVGGDACGVDLFVDGAEGEGEVAEAVREESCGGGFEGFRDDFRHPLEEEG